MQPDLSSPDGAADHRRLRQRMVDEQLPAIVIRDARIRDAMAKVPRHLFVPPSVVGRAYEDMPLPIGHGQTISQPLMVAVMLQAAEIEEGDRVLEIGAGSGYQAALLGELAREVHAIEIIPELAEAAGAVLDELGASNVHVHVANGSIGFAEAAPFDVIIVAAGAPSVPPPLVAQLNEGGRLIIPVGQHRGFQTLQRIRRFGSEVQTEDLDVCAFVPLVGELGVDPAS